MGLLARDGDSTHSTKTYGSMDLISHKVPVMRQIKIPRVVPGLNTEDSSITAFDLKIKELWKIKSSLQLQGPQRIRRIRRSPDGSTTHRTARSTGLSKAALPGRHNAICVLQGWRSLLMPLFCQCQLWLWWLKMSQWWQAEKFNLFILVCCSESLLVKKISQNIVF